MKYATLAVFVLGRKSENTLVKDPLYQLPGLPMKDFTRPLLEKSAVLKYTCRRNQPSLFLQIPDTLYQKLPYATKVLLLSIKLFA